jgi:tricorn protease
MHQTGYHQFATIAGDTIVSVCEDDLWNVPRTGGLARRLTASSGEIRTPHLSPDGTLVAFVASEEGRPEVYVMPADGGIPRRLTFQGAEVCLISGWTPDGAYILFASDAGSPFAKETFGFRISKNGGLPEPLHLGHARAISAHPDGRLVIGRNNDDPARWKRYRGGTAGDIWVDAEGKGIFNRLISLKGNCCRPFWVGERIAFLSDHEGIANIYSVRADGADLRRHTHETEYFARFPSTDGKYIVYTAGAAVRVLDLTTDTVAVPNIQTPSSAPQTARRFEGIAKTLEHVTPNPDGTSLALISRGQPFTMPLWEGAVVRHGKGSTVRYRCPTWLHDGKRFACVSDESGYERVEIHDAVRENEPQVVTQEEIGRITELAASPTSDILAVANHRYELLLIDLNEQRVRTIDKSPASRIHDITFSPDGRWIAYSCAIHHDQNSVANPDTAIIRIAEVTSGIARDATPLLRVDRCPAWDPEGKCLYFISTRDFNPVYDALQFDLSFPQASRPFLVTLRRDVPSPFVPLPTPIHKDAKTDEKDEDKSKEDEPIPIEIDFDGITGRVLGFPVEEGDYEQIVAAKGRVLFTRFPVRGIKPHGRSWDEADEVGTLLAYDFEQQRSASLAEEVGSLTISADHRTIAYTSHEKMRVIDALGDLPDDDDDVHPPPSEPGRRSGWIDLTRADVLIEPRDEWKQMYLEAWRMQREQFWDAAMSGIDWEMVRERYAKLLPLVHTRSALSDLIWEMQGELGTSHAYEIGGDHREPHHYHRGFLGADTTWDAQTERYRITRIYRGDSWNREIDSPLAEPGHDIREGDAILAVGGRAATPENPLDELLVNLAGRETWLTIASGEQTRRVLVHTLRDERMLRYRAWVESNRLHVHERTNGRVGYLHIPDMGPWGFSEFHRGFLSEFNREGLIVDVRYNRGGHVSPLLLEKLVRKRIGYDVSRHGPPVPYPPESVGGPLIALTNQFAGSDGDIFSHAFKLLGLGPLVGKRTWGGVIGINPYHHLVDGTITTQPEFSFWFTDVGWGVENYGTEPTHDIDITPQDAKNGHDPQMEKALELIADLQTKSPNGKPHFNPRPHLPIPATLNS